MTIFKAQKQMTLALIKPHVIRDKNVGKIIKFIEANRFEIVHMQQVVLHPKILIELYKEHQSKPFFRDLIESMMSGPIVVLVLRSMNAVRAWRSMMPHLRKKYSNNITENAVHSSATVEDADRELSLLFN